MTECLKNLTIKINGLERQTIRHCNYFKYVQPFETHKINSTTPGIYIYSFSIDNDSFQPSGAINMSRIKNVELQVETRTPWKYSELLEENIFISSESKQSSDYLWDYNFYIYSINYNILRISSGMGGLAFSN